jgi:hypothetical protein
MKKMHKLKGRLYLILFVFINISTFLPAQQKQDNTLQAIQDILSYSNDYYGEDDDLINGCVYPLPDFRIKGSPYLFDDNWSQGAVYIKGKCYKNLLLKYDLIIEALVLNIKINDNNNRLINLNKSQIDSFLINDRLFVNSRLLISDKSTQSFFELINKNDYSLVIKHKKDFLKTYNDLSPFGRFSSLKSDVSLLHNGILLNANNLNAFLKNYAGIDKKKIKEFVSKNEIKYTSASSHELKILMNYCTKITSNKNEN